MKAPRLADILLTTALAVTITYFSLSIKKLTYELEQYNDPYMYQRDTFALSPTMIMYEEIRFLDGVPLDTTNVWRRDISEFKY